MRLNQQLQSKVKFYGSTEMDSVAFTFHLQKKMWEKVIH